MSHVRKALLFCLLLQLPAACQSPPIDVTRDVPYSIPVAETASEWLLDIYAPTAEGDWPVVLIFHGSEGSKEDEVYRSLAETLALEGAVVFVPNNRRGAGDFFFKDDPAGFRELLENAACAVQFARSMAAEYGGQPEPVSVVGHSAGGYTGLWAALAGDQTEQLWNALAQERGSPPSQVACAAEETASPIPDVLIGYAGGYTYFRSLEEEDPALFELVNPDTYVGRNKNVVIHFIQGKRDVIIPDIHQDWARELQEMLLETGYQATWSEIEAGHSLDSPARAAVMDIFWDTVGRK